MLNLCHLAKVADCSTGYAMRQVHVLRMNIIIIVSMHGLQLIIPDKAISVKYHEEIENDNKTEVARGLCENNELAC